MIQERDNPCVLAMGFFDGVHRGHGALLERTLARAGELGVTPAVMTFDTHPDTLVRGEAVALINSAPDRALLIRSLYGIDRVEFLRFTRETMQMPWREFLDAICREWHCVHFVVGYDFRFGWKGEGDTDALAAYCREKGLGWDVVPKVEVDGVTVSSTLIRTLLSKGEMSAAARFMGHPHILTDTVRHGQRLGRRLGAPTVNMQFSPGVLVPPYGVYAARFRLPEGVFPAVTNIGTRPTVAEGNTVTVESHILDYQGNLYGKTLTVELWEFLRAEQHFDSLQALADQIARDGAMARERLKEQL